MKIGFLGTGLMGEPMVQRLLSAGLPVIAYNRTPSKLKPLEQAGASVTASVEEAIQQSDCLILMLTNAQAIEEILLSENRSLANRTVIQMSTIAPFESKAIQQAVIERGGDYLEAPVLGSIPEAQQGSLIVMVGASQEQFQQWLGVLKNFGSEPVLIGPVGSASAMKLALNQLIAALTTAFALSLGFLQRQDVDIDQFMAILRTSAVYAPTFDKKLKRMIERNFANPNFKSQHLLKDVNLFLQQAQELDLNLSSLEGVHQIIQAAINLGMEQEDYSALYSVINPEKP
ncbi:NAD(P)-dependent oxidoreductase [Gloeothece verrucosa]|uniref:6-phosphogluconate dehydrogenase NAD-binding protein n=1 Tax=Gloeothece verrucosa (strain PCC 7822) TaxID=497965 RepID=E0UCP5_GLOV7|nr:NAD(P)-dependent oxidoreductase [Gloeothece verrucosa]ADN15239.1 6-phosphogluconate dehydrogenase NAD-binding protein [Gloeothece verrucosa PCC 7822]